VILIAAVMVHVARPNQDATAFAATTTTTAAAPTVSPTVTPAPVPTVVPPADTTATDTAQTGTLDLQRPAVAGHVWLDGQKLAAGSATVPCGKHQIKVGARGRAHTIDVPCGGEVRVSR
jgi:hypothetical protein